MDALLVVGVLIAIAVGIVGTVIPLLPGLALIWAAALVWGLAEGFGGIGVAAFALITVLAIAGTVAGFALPARAATASGAPRRSVLVGAGAAIVAAFVIPVVGLPIGFVAGTYLAERARTGDGAAAMRTTMATLKGWGIGALAQMGAAIAMAITWGVWAIAG